MTEISFVFLNGDIVESEKAVVSVFDRGFLYGDGVFETLRTYNGNIFCLNEHLERLFRSSNLIGLTLPWSKSWLQDAITLTIDANRTTDDLLVRLTVTRGMGTGHAVPKVAKPTIVITARSILPPDNNDLEQGWQAIVAATRRNSPDTLNPGAKTLNFLNNILAKNEAETLGVQEAIMLNRYGKVAEGTASNIFCLKNGILITPPEADGILSGVTRNVAIRLARGADIKLSEESLWPGDLYGADELFLTLTSVGIMPVTVLDGLKVGAGKAGAITKKMLSLFRESTINGHYARELRGF